MKKSTSQLLIFIDKESKNNGVHTILRQVKTIFKTNKTSEKCKKPNIHNKNIKWKGREK